MTLRLQNKIFISTRPKNSSTELVNLLNEEGATVLELPLIEIAAARLSEQDLQYLVHPGQFNWIIFTSPNGVKYYFEILKSLKNSCHLPKDVQFAVIGEKTGKVLQDFGYKASFINPGSAAGEFSKAFLMHISNEIKKPKILLPLGNLARTVIQDQLKEAAECIRIDVYNTVVPEQFEDKVVQQIEKDNYDMLIFTSPSGVVNFLKASPSSRNKNIRMACIGQVTRQEALENGFDPLVTALNSTAEGIVDSIINHYISNK